MFVLLFSGDSVLAAASVRASEHVHDYMWVCVSGLIRACTRLHVSMCEWKVCWIPVSWTDAWLSRIIRLLLSSCVSFCGCMLNKAFGIMSKPLQHVRVTSKGGVIGDLRQDTGEMLDCPEMASPPLICLMFPMCPKGSGTPACCTVASPTNKTLSRESWILNPINPKPLNLGS